MTYKEILAYKPDNIIQVNTYPELLDLIDRKLHSSSVQTIENRFFCQELKDLVIYDYGAMRVGSELDKYDFIEDSFTPNHYTRPNRAIRVLSKILNLRKYTPTSVVFTPEYKFTDLREHQLENLTSHVATMNQGEFITSLTEEELNNQDFFRGKINSRIFFHTLEMKQLDKALPYKKFDNTYKKVDIEQLRSRLIGAGVTGLDLQNSINGAVKDNLKYGVDSLTYTALEGIKYTFGCEWETSMGRPQEIADLNLKAVHDGSLRDEHGETPGGEYVSGVLIGDSGLNQMYDICRVLANSCKLNDKCGYHVHVGSLEWSREDVVFAWILGQKIEEEVFTTLPKSRRNNTYCRRLPAIISTSDIKTLKTGLAGARSNYNISIDEIYNKIYNEVAHIKNQNLDTTTILSPSINKHQNHPLGSKCGYNKDTQRYCWLNFVTLMFNTKGVPNSHTLEFRNHGATLNYTKSKNWLKFCFAFCKFVENHKIEILGNPTINDLVKRAYPKTGDSLVKYFDERKQVFNLKDESIDFEETELIKKKTIKEVVCA